MYVSLFGRSDGLEAKPFTIKCYVILTKRMS